MDYGDALYREKVSEASGFSSNGKAKDRRYDLNTGQKPEWLLMCEQTFPICTRVYGSL